MARAELEGSLRVGDVARRRAVEEPNAKGAKGAADADAEMEVDNLAAEGFFGWMGREQLGAGSVMARAFPIPPLPPRQQRALEAFDREGECQGSVAFISCLDSEIDDLLHVHVHAHVGVTL